MDSTCQYGIHYGCVASMSNVIWIQNCSSVFKFQKCTRLCSSNYANQLCACPTVALAIENNTSAQQTFKTKLGFKTTTENIRSDKRKCNVNVVKENSRGKCVPQKSFGCMSNASYVWVNNGCNAVFLCNSSHILCRSLAGKRNICSCKGSSHLSNKVLAEVPQDTGDRVHVVIVIPFRNRHKHYERFASNFLKIKRTQWHAEVIVVEQNNSMHFNRAWLMNVGIAEAKRRFKHDDVCVVTHDVDMLADKLVDYSWCKRPTQICSELSCFNGGVPYKTSAGGVVQATLRDWYAINGFTNEAHGWGGEDDDLYYRLKQNHLLEDRGAIRRPPKGFGRCHCMHDKHHTKRLRHPIGYKKIVEQIGRLRRGSREWEKDGLSNLKYNVLHSLVDKFGHHVISVSYSSEKSLSQESVHRNVEAQGTCAIVFNSGVLLKAKEGQKIDSYDRQIRFNMLPTTGFEENVGKRTTHHVVNFYAPAGQKSSAQRFAELNDATLTGVTFQFHLRDKKGYHRWKSKTNSKWLLVQEGRLRECFRKVGLKTGWCSSGMMGVLWAMTECSQVTVFGYNHDPCYPYHYTDPIPETCVPVKKVGDYMETKHNFEAEHKLLRELHQDGKIQLNNFPKDDTY